MIKVLSNPKSDKYLSLKKEVLSSNFFWQYSLGTNRSVECLNSYRDIPYYSHTVIQRPTFDFPFPVPLDSEWKKSIDVFNEIMEYNDISYKTIYRLNFNSTFYVHDKMTPPHVDHDYPHKNMIVYLSNFTGGFTHVFKKTWPEHEFSISPKDMKYSFKGEEDDIITFDGFNYHCMECPKQGERRIVMIVTYLT